MIQIIPNAYRLYEATPGQPEEFLLADVQNANGQRILVFGRQSKSIWSDHRQHLFVDGTFKIAPPMFSQVYVISAKRGGYVLPVVYALLPNKQRATYDTLFTTMKAVSISNFVYI